MICSPVAQSTKSMLQRNVRQFTHILISMLHCATAHEEGILWANISISDNMYGTTRHRSTKRKIGKEEGINRVYNDLENIVCLHVVSSDIVGVCTQCTAHLIVFARHSIKSINIRNLIYYGIIKTLILFFIFHIFCVHSVLGQRHAINL